MDRTTFSMQRVYAERSGAAEVKAYSTNEEDWTLDIDTVFGEVEDQELEFYYEADAEPMSADKLGKPATWLIEWLGEKFYDVTNLDEPSPFEVSPSAEQELSDLIRAWIDKHVNLSDYFIIQVKSIKKIPVSELEPPK